MADEQTKIKKPEIGIPMPEFEAAVDVVEQLQHLGKFQIFVVREDAVRFIGEVDEFRVAFGKRTGGDPPDKKKAEEYLEELQSFLQVLLVAGSVPAAVHIFESHVFDDEIKSVKDDPELLKFLKRTLLTKLEIVSSRFVSSGMRERAKRISTTIGPVLEDLDAEVVTVRRNWVRSATIESPFLRISLRYSSGGQSKFPFSIPPWVPIRLRDLESFDLECDESDIDLLINRLLQAKELLKKSIDVRVSSAIGASEQR